MRHGKAFNHLSRKKGHRSALLRNLAGALIKYKRIQISAASCFYLEKFYITLHSLCLTGQKGNTDYG